MFLYFTVFAIVLVLYNTYRSAKNKHRAILWFLSCFILPVGLACCRDLEDFGKDINLYAIPTFDATSYYTNFIDYWKGNGNEIGYCALNWIVSRFTDDVRVFLGVHQFICFFFVIMASTFIKNKNHALFFVAFYLLMFFNNSIVLFRQILAITLIMLMTSLYLSGHKKVFWLGLIVAQMFHNSSIVACIIPLVIWATEKFQHNIKIIYWSVILFVLTIYMTFRTTFATLVLMVSDKYENYFDQDDQKMHKTNVLISVGLLFTTFLSTTKDVKKQIVRIFVILYLGFITLGALFETANRLADNIISPIMLLLPFIFVTEAQRRKAYCIVFGTLIFVYIFNSLSYGWGDTVPYKSKMLGF